jgi:hypothetical protein
VHEWRAFHEAVTKRAQPDCSAADFRRDLELFAAMIELMGPARAEVA